jgi:hypothetical protein
VFTEVIQRVEGDHQEPEIICDTKVNHAAMHNIRWMEVMKQP